LWRVDDVIQLVLDRPKNWNMWPTPAEKGTIGV